MKKSTLLLGLIVSGCATVEYQGVSSNAFPRHSLNYLFSESFSLDYTVLQASEWKPISQVADGSYVATELIKKSETDENWRQKWTIFYYPKVTVNHVSTLVQSVAYLKERLAKNCREGQIEWAIIEHSDDYYTAQVNNSHCEKMTDQYALYRLQQTDAGLNVLIYSQKTIPDLPKIEEIATILKQAKVVEYTPKPLTYKNEQTLSY